MAFIRTKRQGNRTYYYLVKNKREGKKVRQKVIKYLGTERPTGESLEEIKRIIEDFEKKLKPINKPPIKKQRRNFKRREK